MPPSALPPSALRFIAMWTLFIAINVCLRWPALSTATFINDDAALILGSQAVHDLGFLHFFTNSYGPRVIRPFQLIGMHTEHAVIGLGAGEMLMVGIVYLSFAQAVFHSVLRRFAGEAASILGVSLIGAGYVAAEPVLWISDRHDLYLLAFFAMSLLVATRLWDVRKWSQRLILAGAYCAFLFGALFSNEKATAIPVMLSALALLAPRRDKGEWIANSITVWAVSAITLAGYFMLRLSVIGDFVGGYNSKVLPDNVGWAHLLRFIRNVLSLPWRPAMEFSLTAMIVLACIVSLFAWAIVIALRSGRFGRVCAVCSVAIATITLSGVPTFQYLTADGYTGGSRFMWLPNTVACLWISVVSGYVIANATNLAMRLGSCAASLIVWIYIIQQGTHGTAAYATAHEFTRTAQRMFVEHCSCVDTDSPQSEGLPYRVADVNVFTEKAWIEYELLIQGMPRCVQDGPRCRVRFELAPDGRLTAAPVS